MLGTTFAVKIKWGVPSVGAREKGRWTFVTEGAEDVIDSPSKTIRVKGSLLFGWSDGIESLRRSDRFLGGEPKPWERA